MDRNTDSREALLERRNDLMERAAMEQRTQTILARLLLRHKPGQDMPTTVRFLLHDSRQQTQWLTRELDAIEREMKAREGQQLALPLHAVEPAADEAAA